MKSELKSYGKLKKISEMRSNTHRAWDGFDYLNFECEILKKKSIASVSSLQIGTAIPIL